jgi:hypothetical protein
MGEQLGEHLSGLACLSYELLAMLAIRQLLFVGLAVGCQVVTDLDPQRLGRPLRQVLDVYSPAGHQEVGETVCYDCSR